MFLCNVGHSAQYYVSPDGDDMNVGTSMAFPFRSLSHVNTLNFSPGDIISFEGGKTFSGHLIIDDSGTVGSPITVNSYGVGKAIFLSNAVLCFEAKNVSHLVVQGLILNGDYTALSGGAENTSSNTNVGIVVNAASMDCSNILISEVEASGFKWAGIRFMGSANFSVIDSEISGCVTHDNGSKGIETSGVGSSYHQNILISHCNSYSNEGWTETPTGSGIHCSRVNDLTVEYCLASDNGGNNYSMTGGGGGGIWASNCTNVLFQYNESHDNKTGHADGHGFDIDGNVQNAIVQYNYAHGNYGAGFLIFQYGSGATSNVTVRYNVSVNDGTFHKQGAIHVHRASGAGAATEDLFIYNNTVYNSDAMVPMVHLNGGVDEMINNANVFNNLFVQPNNGEVFETINGATITTGNNHLDRPLGGDGNALLNDAGFETTIGNPAMMSSLLTAYKLQGNSPLIDGGLDLVSEGIVGLTNVGSGDFYGNAIPQNSVFDIGAHELTGVCADSELLANHTFDDLNSNPIPSWTSHAGTGGEMVGTINNEGVAHLQITDGGPQDYSLQLWQDHVTLEADQLYVVKVRMRAASTRMVKLIVRPTASATNYLDHRIQLTSNFEDYLFAFWSPATVANSRISFLVGADNEDVYIDDVSLVDDCDGIVDECVDYHSVLLNSDVPGGTYTAKEELKSNSQIQIGKNVILKSANSIILESGFEVHMGSEFSALIETCN